MNPRRILYRLRQFWNTLRAQPLSEDLEEICLVLSPLQITVFKKMQPGEQAHSMAVYRRLVAQGETEQALLVAALLHDVGKSRYPLSLWERAMIVLSKALIPARMETWGSSANETDLRSWKRPFIVARQHPAWGAELAQQAGAPPLAVSLIRRHQDLLHLPGQEPKTKSDRRSAGTLEERYLLILQEVDDES